MNPFQIVFKQKLIMVTVSYRLNIFGFFTSMDGESPGNFGLMDQSAALLWIRKNIKLFNGNPNSVTIMGHGSSSILVGLHLISGEWSDDVFHKAIMMSGTVLSDTNVKMPSEYSSAIDETATTFGCDRKPTSNMMECLRRVNAQILAENSPPVDWGPIVDKGLSETTTPFVPDLPRLLVHSGKFRKAHLLIGHTDMEDALDLTMANMMDSGISADMYETLLADTVMSDLSRMEYNESACGNTEAILDSVHYVYKPFPPTMNQISLRKRYIEFATERVYLAPTIDLAMHMSEHAKTFVYRFDLKPKTPYALRNIPTWMGLPHNFELVFVWGFPYWLYLYEHQWDSADKRVSDIVMTMWANFAKFTHPSQVGVYIKWDPFTVQNPGVLIIDRTFNMSDQSTLDYRAVKFWNDYYPNVIQFAAGCCNQTSDAASIHLFNSHNYLVNSFVLIGNFLLLIQSCIYLQQIHYFFQT